MSANISLAELMLLEYLHKHSGSSGERIGLAPKPITRDLRISREQFAEESASLAAHGLAGMRNFRPDANDVPSLKCSSIWLTKKGEVYLKDHRPEPAQQGGDSEGGGAQG